MSACINNGGAASRILLHQPPALEHSIPLDEDAVAALACWQSRPGEIVTLCGPQQDYYRARLEKGSDGKLSVVPFESIVDPLESPLHLTVIQALPQRERFELILQKLTEIGVNRIIPCVTVHSITLEERDAAQKKSHRWPEVLLRAARQCRRAELPQLYDVLNWHAALAAADDCDLRLALCERGVAWRLGEVLNKEKPRRVALLVGPEGGFATDEVDTLSASGWLTVSLGSRILRTETAAIVGAALLQHRHGDLG